MRDTESRDLAGAAYLAREADAYDDDRPSRSDLAYDEQHPDEDLDERAEEST